VCATARFGANAARLRGSHVAELCQARGAATPRKYRAERRKGDACLVAAHLGHGAEDVHDSHCRVGSHEPPASLPGRSVRHRLTLATNGRGVASVSSTICGGPLLRSGAFASRPPLVLDRPACHQSGVALAIMSTAATGLPARVLRSRSTRPARWAAWHSSTSTSDARCSPVDTTRFATPATSSPPNTGFRTRRQVASTCRDRAQRNPTRRDLGRRHDDCSRARDRRNTSARVSGPAILRAASNSPRE